MKYRTKPIASLFALMLAGTSLTGCQIDLEPELPSNPPGETDDFHKKNGWELVFSDEFEGATIDESKWAYEINCWGGGNNEEQCYVKDSDNAFVEEGILHIKAIREEHTGLLYNPDHKDYDPAITNTKPFTSTRLRSVSPAQYVANQAPDFHFENDWKYGRFEIRAKLPEGQGTWPAIWMLPTDWEFGGWAMSGEIDIMEAVNLKAQATDEKTGEVFAENRVHGTLHYGRAWPGNVYSGVEYDFGDRSINPADDFHVYAIEWEEGEIRWFIDGEHFATQTQAGWYTHYQDELGEWKTSGMSAAPFDQNFHLIMNLAIGGDWAANVNEGGVDATINEAEMLIDYVRVYQCKDDDTGVACGTKGIEGSFTHEAGVIEPELPISADFSADPLVIFDSKLAADWMLAKWDGADGGDEYKVVDGYIDLQFSNTGVMYLFSDQGKLDDFSSYVGDYKFKIRWVDGTATGVKIGINDAHGNFAYYIVDQQDFGVSGSEQWTEVTVPVSQMLANSPAFDLTSVDIAGKFEQVGGTDLHIQVKDITISKGEYVAPEVTPLGEEVVLLADTVGDGFNAELYHGYLEDGDADTITVLDGVINAKHNNGGNISIASAAGVMDISDFADGHLTFDLRIVTLGTATDVLVKIAASWPNLGDVALSETTTGLPDDNTWHTFSVPVQTFVDNGNRLDGNGGLDLSNVTHPFVVEAFAGGNLEVEIRNITLHRPLVLLGETVGDGFNAELYHGYLEDGDADTMTVIDGVINVTHVNGGNIAIGSASGAIDVSGFADGHLNFELRVINLGTATDVLVKIAASWPNLGDVALSETAAGLPEDNTWHSYSVPVQTFVDNGNRLDGNGGLDLSNVTHPIVVEGFGGGNLQVEIREVNFTK